MTNNHDITDVGTVNFTSEVIEASGKLPVLVDFWADWCQPCRQLSPLLAALAAELTGKLKVVKVNTDREKELTAKFGIRNLPTVVLFKDGRPIDQFSGLVPKNAILDFLSRHMPRESDTVLQQARETAENGDLAGAISVLKKALADDPDNNRIHPELIGLLMKAGDYEQAGQAINNLPVNLQHSEDITALQARLRFLVIQHTAPDVPALVDAIEKAPDNLQCRYQLSAHKVIREEYEAAMDQLLEIIRRDRSFQDDGARKALLDIFTILGNGGDLVKRYRGKLALLLN